MVLQIAFEFPRFPCSIQSSQATVITLMQQSLDCLIDVSESKQSNTWEESDSCLSNGK